MLFDLKWSVAASLSMLVLYISCYPKVDKYYCPARYPVAPGRHGNHYYGVANLRILASDDPESVDSTRVAEVKIFTVDEDTNLAVTGVEEPQLLVFIKLWEPGFCNVFAMIEDEGYMLRLDGSDNHFLCDSVVEESPRDAQLVLRNVGLSPTPLPEMNGAILEGYYTAKGGAERYSVRLHSFYGDDLVDCSEPGAQL